LNADFLNLLTKSEIEVIADEIGLKAALGEKYSKVMGGKKDEIVKAMLAVEGFDYAGKIPKVLQHVIA
jgi:ParB family chromosome partitioning protein